MKRFLIILLLAPVIVSAQRVSISGYVRDASSGEALIGANILIDSSFTGTVTNQFGFYSLSLPVATYRLRFSFVGYETTNRTISLEKPLRIDINLEPKLTLEGVTVVADAPGSQAASTRMSSISVPVKTIKEIPAFMGEVDVLKAIQLLPGVQSGSEGSSGLYVRGGGPDQNLILLDGVPVYNANHLFGFFSVFNADAINNIELIKGGFPARYGGRLSSVLDISMKEGNMKKFHGEGSIGAIASRLTLEGPIIKDKTSFIVSARRTYLDILTQPIIRLAQGNDYGISTGYYFHDINAKVNHILGIKDRLYLSLYTGKDEFYQRNKPYQYLYEGVIFEESAHSGFSWGNLTSALRWNHLFSDKLFANTTLTYSSYNYLVENYSESIEQNDTATLTDIYSLKFNSGIRDIAGRIDFDFLPHPSHYLKFGGGNTYHQFKPGATVYRKQDNNITGIDSALGANPIYANELFVYAEDDYKISDRFKANVGLHYSGFILNDKYYHALQPRLSARYMLRPNFSFKGSFAMMQQYIHLLTNNNIGLPTDLWVPSTHKVEPQKAWQAAIGISTALFSKLNLTVEGYYKKMNNVLEYKEGATFLNTGSGWEDKILQGQGWAYGIEVFLEKRLGEVHGWIGYTWAHSERQFDLINFGEKFPYKYDRRHDVSLVLSYRIDSKWDMSLAWVYGTGNALTLPTTQYLGSNDYNNNYFIPGLLIYPISSDNSVSAFEKKNSFRTAAYHRLDVGFTRTSLKKWGELSWNFGAYNLYNRRNPFYYYIGYDNRGNKALRRVSIFPIIPSISLSFKF
jgi:hypothetical protein